MNRTRRSDPRSDITPRRREVAHVRILVTTVLVALTSASPATADARDVPSVADVVALPCAGGQTPPLCPERGAA